MANDVTFVSAPSEEGVPAKTGSQAAEPASKGEASSKDSNGSQGRESPANAPSNGDETRRKPSDFYRERNHYRRQVETMAGEISQLKEQIAQAFKKKEPSPPPSAPSSLKFDPDTVKKFWDSPDAVLDGVLTEREKRLLEQVEKKFEEKIPQYLTKRDEQQEFVRNTREAFELIFPKSGLEDKRTEDERAMADPERLARVNQILKDYRLDILTEKFPKEAAHAVLRILANEEKPKENEPQKAEAPKNPNVISKKLVGSTATGSPMTAGGKTMPTLDEIKAQLNALDKEVERNPNYRYEAEFVQKNRELNNQLSLLAKELQGK